MEVVVEKKLRRGENAIKRVFLKSDQLQMTVSLRRLDQIEFSKQHFKDYVKTFKIPVAEYL